MSNTNQNIALKNNDNNVYFDAGQFEQAQRVAKMFSESTIVPEHYKKNIANCFIAIQMAVRMGIDPLVFMQKSFVLHGKPGVEAQVLIGALNNSGLIKGRVNYKLEGAGEARECTAWVVDAKTGEKRQYTVTKADATKGFRGEKQAFSLWNTIPDLMLSYRSATYLIRLNYPEVMLGLYSKDELRDMGASNAVAPVMMDPLVEDESINFNITETAAKSTKAETEAISSK